MNRLLSVVRSATYKSVELSRALLKLRLSMGNVFVAVRYGARGMRFGARCNGDAMFEAGCGQ